MAHERICVVCGTKYQYCPRCKQYQSLPRWMMAYCSSPCRDTYLAVNKYEFEHITAQEALDEINSLKVKVANKEMISEIKAIKKRAAADKKKSEPVAETETE